MESLGRQMMTDLSFYKGKRVFVTGHTGFKGSWLCKILIGAGAVVTGYALPPATEQNLFSESGVEAGMRSVIGDIRDREKLFSAFEKADPQIVFHLAAQPIVRAGYKDPAYTYETNVMGTVNLLECVRKKPQNVKSVLNVTTDKVYKNNEWCWGYREDEPLDGFDPYSNSKSCAELVTHSYKNCFFGEGDVSVSTARAGNVIGGGDFAEDRIIPDCVRAALSGKRIAVRNAASVRPYQHVLEPLFAYLLIAQRQYEDASFAGYYNVGPDENSCITTGKLVDLFCAYWGEGLGREEKSEKNAPHEANYLKLDCSKIKSKFGWAPRWDIRKAVEKTVEWTKVFRARGDIDAVMRAQIREYMAVKK